MKLELRLSVRAEKDVAKALYWYGTQDEFRSVRFIADLERTFKLVDQFPRGAAVVKGTIRQVPMDRFPYVVVYSVRSKELVILRLFHTGRDPKKRFAR